MPFSGNPEVCVRFYLLFSPGPRRYRLAVVNPRRLPMQVMFESSDPDGASMRSTAVRRARFVMRRLSWMVPSVRIYLSDINGPRGGVDKRCVVELKTARLGRVVVTALARDWRAALDGALSRVSRVLLNVWRRSRRTPRLRPVAAEVPLTA
jgi:hypothetical protein